MSFDDKIDAIDKQNVQDLIFLNSGNELGKILAHFGSDKSTRHNYDAIYYQLFKDLREEKQLNVFELGLGTNNVDVPSNMGPNGKPGASLRAWSIWFPFGKVYGADVDWRVLFNENATTGRSSIQTFYCDQRNPEIIKNMWEMIKNDGGSSNKKMNIIIDDGLHEFDANVCFFENSIDILADGGVYIIEDVIDHSLPKWNEKIENEWKQKYPSKRFKIITLPHPYFNVDNTLIIIY